MSREPIKPLVLIVDDDPDLTALTEVHVRRWGYAAHSVGSARQLRRVLESQAPDVVLLDVMLGDADGTDLVPEIHHRWPSVPVIMITRSTSVEAAVRAMKHGAADYITKPLDYQQLRRAVDSALEVHRLSRRREEQERAGPTAARDHFYDLIGRSEAMNQLFRYIESVAPTDVSALLLGETGTGKELVARAIHSASSRCEGPFVPVNAAAIPHELIESALFGHEKGAFTGAREARAGFCEQADGGTLFLDEIAEMDYGVQAKLLRFLQDHQVQRVGASRGRPVDVRVLAATNVDPMEEIRNRRLREDLYYRLRVVSLRLPPLRERGEDVELLARHFLEHASKRHQRGFRDFDAEALGRLEGYPWPGNVREMENLIEEAVVLHRGEVLTAAMLPQELLDGGGADGSGLGSARAPENRWSPRERRRREELRKALDDAEGDPEAAGEILGVSRATVYRWMKKYSIPRP